MEQRRLDQVFAKLPLTFAWEKRIQDVGHGSPTEMSPADALDVAVKASPHTPTPADPDDPNGRQSGDRFSVVPDDYGKVEVRGEIASRSAQHIAIRRNDDRAGETVVYFPRAGFAVIPSLIGVRTDFTMGAWAGVVVAPQNAQVSLRNRS
jgi:hypothetical protein